MLDRIRSKLGEFRPQENGMTTRRASVLIPLQIQSDSVKLLLTKRSGNLRSHSGQVSFPGGKQDSSDRSPLDTALRESHEEIGLNPEEVTILGCLDQIISLHFYLVTPYVGLIPDGFQPRINTLEIESVFMVPLTFFLKGGKHWSEEMHHRKFPVISHHFQYQDYDIWGLTAKLILRLLEVGLDFVPDYTVHHPDAPTWIESAQQFNGTEASLATQSHAPSSNRGR